MPCLLKCIAFQLHLAHLCLGLGFILFLSFLLTGHFTSCQKQILYSTDSEMPPSPGSYQSICSPQGETAQKRTPNIQSEIANAGLLIESVPQLFHCEMA